VNGAGDAVVPGEELVAAGLSALSRGERSIEALLVAVGAPRLQALGVRVPGAGASIPHPELALYHALGRRFPEDTHARYNALLRRLVSYERELERRRYAASPSPDRATGSRAGPLARRGGLD